MKRALLWSLLWTAVTAVCLGVAVLDANFGGHRLWFGLLLLVPLTLGLPTTAGVLLFAGLWSGPPLQLFAALAVSSGFALQVAAALLVRRLRRGRSSARHPA